MKLHLLYNQKVIQVNSTNNVIGRNEVYGIADPEISRKHLLIDQINNTIAHTGITKAYLNGKVIPHTPIPIVNGDRIKLSSTLEILVELTFEISDESDYVVGSGYEDDTNVDVKYDQEVADNSDLNYTIPKKVQKPQKKTTKYGYVRTVQKGKEKHKNSKSGGLQSKGKRKPVADQEDESDEESVSDYERSIRKIKVAHRRTKRRQIQTDSETDSVDEINQTQLGEFSLTQPNESSQMPPEIDINDDLEQDSDSTEDLDFEIIPTSQLQVEEDGDSATASLSDSELVSRNDI